MTSPEEHTDRHETSEKQTDQTDRRVTSEDQTDKKQTSKDQTDRKVTSADQTDQKQTSEEQTDRNVTSEELTDQKQTSEEQTDQNVMSEEQTELKETPVDEEMMFKTRTINCFGMTIPIILQNRNGPCPFIAICNILSLKNKLRLNPSVTEVSQGELLTLVARCLTDAADKLQRQNKHQKAGDDVNRYQPISDVIELLPGLLNGMNVNVKFKRIGDIEFPRERAIFELLEIPLYHGWLVDPDDFHTARAIGTKSYDELQNVLVDLDANKTDALKITETVNPTSGSDSQKGEICTPTPNVVQQVPKDMTGGITALQGELIDKFLKVHASQLTTYGLRRLNYELKELDRCVFFRNDHFNTMFKYATQLYLLVTDEGYKDQPDVVWERLDKVNKTVFVKSNFKCSNPMSNEIEEPSSSEEKNADLMKFEGLGPNPLLSACFENLVKTAASDLRNEKALQEQELELKSDPPASFPSESVVGPQCSSEIASTSEEQIGQQEASEEQTERKETPVDVETMLKTKTINFFGMTTPIILQNRNSPCPFISICNILSLKNKLRLNPSVTEVSQGELLTLVARCLTDVANKLQRQNKHQKAGDDVNRYEPISDVIELLPGLLNGMNVNVKFKRIGDIEFPRERAIFELLEIPLYHGWLVDPDDYDTARAIGTKSYNELLRLLVNLGAEKTDALKITEIDNPTSASDSTVDGTSLETDKASESEKCEICPSAPNVVQEVPKDMTRGITALQGELIGKFLKENATQLTTYGLKRLDYELKELDRCVFFRNDHFNTMFKYAKQLYLLVTDEGYKDQPDVVWERLDKVNKTVFVKSNFKCFNPMSNEIEEPSSSEEKNTDLMKFEGLGPNSELISIYENLVKTAASEMKIEKALQTLELKSDLPRSFPSGFVVGPQNAEYSSRPRPRSALYKKGPKRKKERCQLM